MKRISHNISRLLAVCSLLVMAVLLLPVYVAAAEPPLPTDPLAIRNELRDLRKKSANNDKRVRARIDALMLQLQKLQAQRDAAESQARGEARPDDDDDKSVITREAMWGKVQEAAAKGKGTKLDLAEPVRQEVARIYEEDRDTSIKNPSAYQVQSFLLIDFSRPEASLQVDLLDKFSAVETLVLTGGESGAPVDLELVLKKAAKLPLVDLYIINFRGYVSALPTIVAGFRSLETLALFNNNILRLPQSLAGLKQLSRLYLDMNPIKTVLPQVSELPGLIELGIAKTGISGPEQAELVKVLPDCKVLVQ